ncbi:DUF6894 family protein [Methylobacterium radiotolerans]|uniref:DUF6894 family protein n=1 Tax=Methylobacterium radiotolerans TaxID=31998 RepID=UPI0038CF3357
MPRYFFDTDDGDDPLHDDEGMDLPDASGARDAAIGALPDMARDKLPTVSGTSSRSGCVAQAGPSSTPPRLTSSASGTPRGQDPRLVGSRVSEPGRERVARSRRGPSLSQASSVRSNRAEDTMPGQVADRGRIGSRRSCGGGTTSRQKSPYPDSGAECTRSCAARSG